jgi:hypothetical protein
MWFEVGAKRGTARRICIWLVNTRRYLSFCSCRDVWACWLQKQELKMVFVWLIFNLPCGFILVDSRILHQKEAAVHADWPVNNCKSIWKNRKIYCSRLERSDKLSLAVLLSLRLTGRILTRCNSISLLFEKYLSIRTLPYDKDKRVERSQYTKQDSHKQEQERSESNADELVICATRSATWVVGTIARSGVVILSSSKCVAGEWLANQWNWPRYCLSVTETIVNAGVFRAIEVTTT